MNILIIEDEVHLSHSVAKELTEYGYSCTMCVKLDDNIVKNTYDIVLLSTSVTETDVHTIKKLYPGSIIILLTSYVSKENTLDLLHHGAQDYILKPFMLTQLIDKIQHCISYQNLKMQCHSYESYFKNIFIGSEFNIDNIEHELPMLKLKYNLNIYHNSDILKIQEYIQYIIRTYQDKLTDIELSKKLGISRKSVWEKRKKYSITRE